MFESKINEKTARQILSDISRKLGISKNQLELMLAYYLKTKFEENKVTIDIMAKKINFLR